MLRPNCIAVIDTSRRTWRSKLRPAQIARDPAVEAEVDERGEGPDVLGVGEAAEDSGGRGHQQVDRQREVLVVRMRGERQGCAADHGRERAEQDAEEDRGLEGEVGGEEVRHAHAHPDAEGQRHADHGHQSNRSGAGCDEASAAGL